MEDIELFMIELSEVVGSDDAALGFMAKWVGTRLYFPRALLAEKERQRVRKMLSMGLSRSIVMQRLMATGKSRGAAYWLINRALSSKLPKESANK